MRLYGSFSKVTPQADGTVRVEGVASSEAIDDQGETILAAAMRAAIPDYMLFPALREMHQLSAAGTTLEAVVDDDGLTRIVGHVVDPTAVIKIKNQVYRGFSIGGRVTQRDPENSKIITGLSLSEISLVDRPANPEAIFDCWKASQDAAANQLKGTEMPGLAKLGETPAGEALAAAAAAMEPLQIWSCGNAEHRHIAKSDALKCIEEIAKAQASAALDQPVVDDPAAKSASVAEPDEQQQLIEEPEAKTTPVEEPEAQPDAQATLDAAREAMKRGALALDPVVEDNDKPDKNADKADKADKASETDEVDSVNSVTLVKADKDEKPKGDYGEVEYADPGYKDDKKPRYPVDNEKHIRAACSYINQEKNHKGYSAAEVDKIKSKIVSAWKEKIDKDGPPSASEKASPAADLVKSLYTVQDMAGVIMFLDNMCDQLKWEAMVEGDNSGAPAEARSLLVTAGAFLRSQVQEETAEIMAGTDIDYDDSVSMAMAVAADGLKKMAALTAELASAEDPGQFDALADALTKAGTKHSANNQMLLDTAHECCTKAMGMDGCTKAQTGHLTAGQAEMEAAGAKGWSGGAEKTSAAAGPLIDAMNSLIEKAGSHTALMNVAHDCLGKMTAGGVCGDVGKAGSRHSKETMDHLRKAHDELVAAGAQCDAAKATESVDNKIAAVAADDLAKMRTELEAERIQKAELSAVLGNIVPMIDRLSKRVEQIAQTPLPAAAMVRVEGVGVTKAEDGSPIGRAAGGEADLSPEQIAAAFGKMTPAEQTLALIKASYANPRTVRGFAPSPGPGYEPRKQT